MKYAPHDKDYWEWGDIKQVEKRLNELALCDPEYMDDLRDPLRAAKCFVAMTFLAILFWGGLILIVLAAKTYIGGG